MHKQVSLAHTVLIPNVNFFENSMKREATTACVTQMRAVYLDLYSVGRGFFSADDGTE